MLLIFLMLLILLNTLGFPLAVALGCTLEAQSQVVFDLTEVLHGALMLSVRTRGAGALGLRAPCIVDLGHIPPGTSPPGSESAV